MRNCFLLLALTLSSFSIFAQNKTRLKPDLSGRPNDHVMLQLSADSWLNAPDSISSHISGLNRGLNFYLMFDKPFRKNQKMSFGIGLGVGNSNIFFKDMLVDVAGTSSKLVFSETDSTGNYKKYKLSTTYLEVPAELRFSSKPDIPKKSIKVALGFKIGTLLKAHTKGKLFRTDAGETLIDGIRKESSKKYFNSTRLSVTGRINYGIYGLFASYSLTPLLKNGVGSEEIRQLQIGINISGL